MARSRPHPKRYVRRLESRKPCVHGEPGIVLRPHQIVIRPLVTEKGTHQSNRRNAYSFLVATMANKIQIAGAIQDLFNVRVERVRTQIVAGKAVRFRNRIGQQGDWKKAIVTLHADDKIDFS